MVFKEKYGNIKNFIGNARLQHGAGEIQSLVNHNVRVLEAFGPVRQPVHDRGDIGIHIKLSDQIGKNRLGNFPHLHSRCQHIVYRRQKKGPDGFGLFPVPAPA